MYPNETVNQVSSQTNQKITVKINWKNYTSFIGLVLLIVVSAILSPTFLSPYNLVNIAAQIAAPGILAVGMTFVILTAGIDLSVGSLLALTGVFIAVTSPTLGWFGAIMLTLALGTFIGIFHGYCITKLKVPPFIATLAGLSAYKGLALVTTGAASIPLDSKVLDDLGSGRINGKAMFIILIVAAILLVLHFLLSQKKYDAPQRKKKLIVTLVSVIGSLVSGYVIYQAGGINIQVLVFAGVFAIGWFVLNKTVFGREVYAIGGNPEAAKLAGVKVGRGITIVYAAAGFLAALAGLLVATRLGSGTPQVGNLSELDAIAAVVIGGTSLMGGVGTLGGTIVGVILIGILNNLLSLLNITADMQMIFKGAIILGAVILDGKLSK